MATEAFDETAIWDIEVKRYRLNGLTVPDASTSDLMQKS